MRSGGVRAAVLSLVVVLSACGGSSSSPSTPSPTSGAGSSNGPSGPFVFRASPIDPGTIEFIAALGNLNPPGHTLPTDHIYFYHRLNNQSAPPRTVVAPADGTVQTIFGGSGIDSKVMFRAASPFM